MTELFQNQYRVASARAPWCEYRAGTYFVTVCTREHTSFFGHILPDPDGCGRMHLSPMGLFAQQKLADIPAHHPGVEIPLFTVMPNHLHAIIIVNDDTVRLSSVVGGYKSAVSRYANAHCLAFAWQERYHEHIIRNQKETNMIASYIENNVANWYLDRYHPDMLFR